MEIIIFIIVLAVLILVHELGHFIFAKKTGMRVDEFGLGFPPRLFAIKKGETEYSLNLIPLGGFVKILGENPNEEGANNPRSMVQKSRWAQAMVISAGVIFNVIFAWILISIGFMNGLPVSVNGFAEEEITDAKVVVIDVLENSPAKEAGLKTGDELLFIGTNQEAIQNFNQEEMQEFISIHGGEELNILYQRGLEEKGTIFVTPVDGILDTPAIGISTDRVGIAKLSFFKSIQEGLKLTFGLIVAITLGLISFIWSLITGAGNFSQLTGPIGIVGLVGEAAGFGWIYLLNFTAFISINLAVINFIPFPALDGGRLLFILIEGIIGKNIKPSITNSLNFIGFALLMFLMVAVTYNDIIKLF